MLRAVLLAALAAAAAAQQVFFGLGTAFGGTDYALVRWDHQLAAVFGGTCAATYEVIFNGQAKTDVPCVPRCFKVVTLEEGRGVLRIIPSLRGCEDEVARERTAAWVNESTVMYLRDTDVMYFETFSG